MVWSSFSDFINMGGYAWYVWGSYGVVALMIGAELFLLRRRRQQLMKRLSRLARANKSDSESKQSESRQG